MTASVTPFNFPAMVPLWMWPMAVACGNTFVLKPSERYPSSTLPIAEYIYSEGCRHGKRVQALGGAKNHAVVMPDADVPNALNALRGAAFGSYGERCMAIPLAAAVGDDIDDAKVTRLKAEMAKMTVGCGFDAKSDMGPLVTTPRFEKVRGYVGQGVKEGATLLVDGRNVHVVGVNAPLPAPMAYHSFGGWKRSLFSDLHAYGSDAVRFYTKRKTITQRWPSAGVRDGTVFAFPSSR